VVRLRSVRVAEEAVSADFVSVHVLGEALRSALPARGCLVEDAYIPALRRGAAIHTFGYQGEVRDVGDLGAYLEANLSWLSALGQEGWIHPSARVAPRVRVTRSVVGEGARVAGDGDVDRVVVWPGAVAVAPIAQAIVTPEAVVPVP
jgi:hypothetical protein